MLDVPLALAARAGRSGGARVNAQAEGTQAAEMRSGGSTRTLRPNASLSSQSRTVAATLTLPVFAAMLWFAIPRGTWPRVVVAFAVIALVGAVLSYLLSRVRIVVDRDGLLENTFFGSQRRISAKRIASVLIVPVYRGQSLDTSSQLFAFDASGEPLLRMREHYWGTEALSFVADAYDVPVTLSDRPLTRGELRRDHADLLFWFERWPWLGSLCIAGGVAALSLLLIALMSSQALIVG
ncbi:hypothetical protein D4765_18165 [Subtercola vilae]|uniref:PH domain-containing protein n=1 Tax=Subtercola vilae TaxID=2056433 RepID=A0A4T2BE12_9MICO|nr:hypothetical protein D4765_18165 [Subtercola vilae]